MNSRHKRSRLYVAGATRIFEKHLVYTRLNIPPAMIVILDKNLCLQILQSTKFFAYSMKSKTIVIYLHVIINHTSHGMQ